MTSPLRFAVLAASFVACADPRSDAQSGGDDGSTASMPGSTGVSTATGVATSTDDAGTTAMDPTVVDDSSEADGSSDESGGIPLPPCPDDAPEPTPLAALAADLAPGEWAQLATDGFDGGLVLAPCGEGSNIVEYADNAAWDPISRRLLFLGSSHGDCYGSRFVIYSECTNSWSIGTLPPEIPDFGSVAHAYHHNTVDPATGDLYYRHYGSTTVWRFATNGDQAWSMHSQIALNSPGSVTCCGGLQWFPEANALVYLDGGEGLWIFADDAWRMLANTAIEYDPDLPTLAIGPYDNIIEYDALHGIVLLGGGGDSGALFRLDADESLTPLAPAPAGVALQTVYGLDTIDPATGNLVVFATDGTGWQLDPIADAWSPVAESHPVAPRGWFEGAETDIPALGVSLHFVYAFDDSAVWIYRHAGP